MSVVEVNAEVGLPDAVSVASEAARGSVAKKRSRNPLVRYSLMLVRRSHLYFGLLLVPWALLYGITAYLFNHPTHFSSNETRTVLAKQSLATSLGVSNWDPSYRANMVLLELQKRFEKDNRKIDLLNAPTPKFQGKTVSASFDWEDKTYSLSIPIDSIRVPVRVTPKRKELAASKKAFFEVEGARGGSDSGRGRTGQSRSPNSIPVDTPTSETPSRSPLRIDEDLTEKCRSYVAELATNLDPQIQVNSSEIKISAVPELVFETLADGERWECKHNALSGSVSTRVVGSNTIGSDFSWRRFLLRLHTAHTYPSEGGVRWYWAVVVDLMAFVMVFWGVSGIVMWWQIKSTRRFGTLAMVISLVSAAWLFVEMFRLMHS